MHQKISEPYREKIYEMLSDDIMNALGTEDFFTEDAEDSAVFIKDHLDAVGTGDDLVQFLLELSQKWRLFEHTYQEIKSELESYLKMQQVQQQIQEIQQ